MSHSNGSIIRAIVLAVVLFGAGIIVGLILGDMGYSVQSKNQTDIIIPQ
jgi:hypothetical protein